MAAADWSVYGPFHIMEGGDNKNVHKAKLVLWKECGMAL